MKILFKQNKEKTEIQMLEIKQNKQMSKQGCDQIKNFKNYRWTEFA